MHAADIARKLGIKSWDEGNWIVSAILYRLDEDERVKARCNARGEKTGWKLTAREKNRRADVSN